MKINKLFHWLYAFLMLLPLVVFLPTGLYYAFNEHADNGTQTATATAEVEYQYKYETNEVNTLNDLVEGNIYYAESLRVADNYNNFDTMSIILYEYSSFSFNSIDDESYDDFLYGQFSGKDTYIRLNVVPNDDMTNTWLVLTNNENFEFDYSFYYCDYTISDVVFSFSGNFVDYYTHYNSFITGLSSTDYNVIESANAVVTSIEYNNDNSIVNAMSSAWYDVWQLPFFSWAGSSFLADPFNYITVLFGIPDNSVFVYALSYWLSISIIWLVFDIVIYVPMLIHRWLDKASLS